MEDESLNSSESQERPEAEDLLPPEEQPQDDTGDDHHESRRDDLLVLGPGDLPHLDPDLPDETRHPLDGTHDSLARLERGGLPPRGKSRIRAGQEGLEPPTLGFGDRCSTT